MANGEPARPMRQTLGPASLAAYWLRIAMNGVDVFVGLPSRHSTAIAQDSFTVTITSSHQSAANTDGPHVDKTNDESHLC